MFRVKGCKSRPCNDSIKYSYRTQHGGKYLRKCICRSFPEATATGLEVSKLTQKANQFSAAFPPYMRACIYSHPFFCCFLDGSGESCGEWKSNWL